ncbi:MAG: hypothetical protein GY799_30175 [Desulfobulbaceae bacterium]|nr:hypothetical protein [Desulfobulbaceae bacterium]
MSRQIKKDGRPENKNQCDPKIFPALISELPGKNVSQYYEYQTYVDEKSQQTDWNKVIKLT